MRRVYFPLLFLCASMLGIAPSFAGDAPLRSDGIHTQPWMKSLSFLDLKEDLAEAQAKGKGLVILFEQPGCGSCKRLHEENFSQKDLVSYITEHFDVLQINMFGDNEVTDFAGNVTSERELTQDLLINFSPTTIFYGNGGEELFRVPGYLKPYFYQSAFEYVVDGGPQKKILFPRWLKAKRDRLEGKSS